jgi:hypothetical protein
MRLQVTLTLAMILFTHVVMTASEYTALMRLSEAPNREMRITESRLGNSTFR